MTGRSLVDHCFGLWSYSASCILCKYLKAVGNNRSEFCTERMKLIEGREWGDTFKCNFGLLCRFGKENIAERRLSIKKLMLSIRGDP